MRSALPASNGEAGQIATDGALAQLVAKETRCVAPYRVRRETIEILRAFHASRRLPGRW
jgi:plasmid stabilization system protein ParE